jgi:hypothetical protein
MFNLAAVRSAAVPFARTQALSLGRHCSMALSTTFCFSSAQTQLGKALLQVIDVPYRCLVDAFLYQPPDPVVDWIEVR